METQTYFCLDLSKLSLKKSVYITCLILILALSGEDQAGYGLTGSTRTFIGLSRVSNCGINSVFVFQKQLYATTLLRSNGYGTFFNERKGVVHVFNENANILY